MTSQSQGGAGFGSLIAVPLVGFLVLIVGVVGLAAGFGAVSSSACAPAAAAPSTSGKKWRGIPTELLPIYQEASAKYRLGPKGPSILASVNWNETGFGTNMADPPGAYGWMSFLPESWRAFGKDGDGDGIKDAYDPDDAIHAAAGLLRHHGAPEDWHAALFGYNHSNVYVADVQAEAKKWNGIGSIEGSASCGVSAPNDAVAKMIAEADRLSAKRPRTEYRWGGSHGITPTPMDGPFDCSSAVSHLLQVGCFKNETMTTIGFHTWGKPGPGQWVTILNKPYEPEAHVILRFEPGVTPPAKRYWGTSGFIEGGGKGPGWIPESTFDAGYLSRFEERHPPGL